MLFKKYIGMYKQLQDLEWRISNSKSSEKLKEALDTLKEMKNNLTFTNKSLQQKVFSQLEEVYNCARYIIMWYVTKKG